MKLNKMFDSTVNRSLLMETEKRWARYINTPRALALHLLFVAAMNGDNEAANQIKDFPFNPDKYLDYDIQKFHLEYPYFWFLSTNPNYPGYPDSVRQERTLQKFLATEDRCKNTVSTYFEELAVSRAVRRFNTHMRKHFSRVFKHFSLDKLKLRHGPGAAIGASGRQNKLAIKTSKLTISTNAYKYWLMLADQSNVDQQQDVEICDMQQLLVDVAKNGFENRAITTQPIGDCQLQLAVLDWLLHESLPRTLGITVTMRNGENAAQKNGRLCVLGSQNGSYACLDGSSAGQHIPYALVAEWTRDCNVLVRELLLKACSQRHLTMPNGEIIPLHKYAMAGNGLEWVMQCIIYDGVLSFVIPKQYEYGINGDDWVVPSHHYHMVMQMLTFIGQKMNPTKSFLHGAFREASGTDAFNGRRILKTKAKTINEESISYAINLHNSIYRVLGGDLNWHEPSDILLHIRKRFNQIPNVPASFGEAGFHRPLASCKARWRNGIRYFTILRKYYRSEPQTGVVMLSKHYIKPSRKTRKAKERKGQTYKKVHTYTRIALLSPEQQIQNALAYGAIQPNHRHSIWTWRKSARAYS